MKSSKDLHTFLKRVVPYIVHRHVVNARSLKACSAVSPTFEYLAKKNGFNAVTAAKPGHYYNVVQTEDATWLVDLSHIQFTCQLSEPWDDPEDDPEAWDEYNNERKRVYNEIADDPFSATRIERLGGPEIFEGDYEMFVTDTMPFDEWHQEHHDDSFKWYEARGYQVPRHLRESQIYASIAEVRRSVRRYNKVKR